MTYEKHNSYLQLSKKIEVAYLDLNLISEIDINWESDSYDGGEHLNYNGAVKVSSFIGNYLKENYNLPDHREDDSFASWNDTLLDNSKKEKKEKS